MIFMKDHGHEKGEIKRQNSTFSLWFHEPICVRECRNRYERCFFVVRSGDQKRKIQKADRSQIIILQLIPRFCAVAARTHNWVPFCIFSCHILLISVLVTRRSQPIHLIIRHRYKDNCFNVLVAISASPIQLKFFGLFRCIGCDRRSDQYICVERSANVADSICALCVCVRKSCLWFIWIVSTAVHTFLFNSIAAAGLSAWVLLSKEKYSSNYFSTKIVIFTI